MAIVDWLAPAKKPARRWFLLIQDYIIFALIFVSGTLGLFVNLWSDSELNCVPVLDCGQKPHATDCVNKTNRKVVQDISLVVTNYIASACSKHIQPPYLPYADLVLFGACVLLWVLHNLWLKMPPYSEIVVSYGELDEEQRDKVTRKLDRDQGDARNGEDEPFIAPADAFVKAIKRLDKACWLQLNRLVQFSDGLCCILFAIMGILLVLMYINLTSPFSCELDPTYSIGVTYTSIECELRKIGGIHALYVICATGAFIICVFKFVLLCYYGCPGCKCSTGPRQDAEILRRLLAENLTSTDQERKISAHQIDGLKDWHEMAFLAQVRNEQISYKDIPDLQTFTDGHYQRRTDINLSGNDDHSIPLIVNTHAAPEQSDKAGPSGEPKKG